MQGIYFYTGWMAILIYVHIGGTCHFVDFVIRRLIYLIKDKPYQVCKSYDALNNCVLLATHFYYDNFNMSLLALREMEPNQGKCFHSPCLNVMLVTQLW